MKEKCIKLLFCIAIPSPLFLLVFGVISSYMTLFIMFLAALAYTAWLGDKSLSFPCKYTICIGIIIFIIFVLGELVFPQCPLITYVVEVGVDFIIACGFIWWHEKTQRLKNNKIN
ncbi:hypothetical protein [Proteus cibi]|uniref:hypothetical protein n=1 Tax=Proteus cibi TaxID=2050966 RepID=UPI0035A723FC